jgi:hypothetical protein
MKKWICVGLLGLLGATSSQAAYDQHKRWWGLNVGVFIPNSGEIRDKFSDVFFRVGVSPFSDRISEKWKFAVDFNAVIANKNGNHMLVAPVTFGFARSFGSPEARAIPFVQFGVGPAFYDYDISRGSERFDTTRVGGNANVEAGVLLDRRFAVTGRADFYTKTDDFDFSGISVTVAYAVFRW